MTVAAPPLDRLDTAFRRWADAHPERPDVLCDQSLALASLFEVLADLLAQRARGAVLDLGTGFGAVASRLAARGRRVVGVDVDRDVLDAAREIAATAGLETRARFVRADATALPFGDGSFGLVVASLLFQHLAAPEQVVAEASRVLGPQGTVAVFDVDDGLGVVHPRTAALERLEEAFSAWQAGVRGDRQVGRKVPALLDAAGFGSIEVFVLPEARYSPTAPGSEPRRLTTRRLRAAREGIVGAGVVSAAAFDALVADVESAPARRVLRCEGRVLVLGRKDGAR